MQESKNGLCNKPCLNRRQAWASRAILTCCKFNVVFTSRHLHTNLTSATVEMGLLSSQPGLFTSVNHPKFNKASALRLTVVQESCFRSGLQEHTSRSGASISSSIFLCPIDLTGSELTPCPHPRLTRARQPEGC